MRDLHAILDLSKEHCNRAREWALFLRPCHGAHAETRVACKSVRKHAASMSIELKSSLTGREN